MPLLQKHLVLSKPLRMACGAKQKALANLELPNAYEADVWFKLPMFLPSKVEFLTANADKKDRFLDS